MPRLSKIGAAALAAFGWTSGGGVTASYLVVAGGGASNGDAQASGGGGAGGLLTGTTSLNPTLSYTITVGAGATASSSTGTNSPGSDSSISTIAITASGGGAGGAGANGGVKNGGNGGSGGGGGTSNAAGTSSGGTAVSGQGNAGGTGTGSVTNTSRASGGGGGAGAAGSNGSSNVGGNGGVGVSSSISGTSTFYAGGGGGGGQGTGGSGGNGGGGNGGGGNGSLGVAGAANTGGGGGAGYEDSASYNGRANGGSGIVIISYAGAQQFGGGVVTSSGGNTIHTFTTSGTLSPLNSLTANFLVVAGGGGGGAYNGGGGGAGGLRSSVTNTGGGGSLESTLTIDTNSIYTVTVGAGGSGQITSTQSVAGSNSSFLSISSIGGGKGGGYTGSFYSASTGGSGGGAPYAAGGSGAAGTANQGFAGGNGDGSTNSGGGGGAGAVGGNATASVGGNGGVGVAVAISGTSTFYAGGGGGAGFPGGGGSAGSGGNGGGGNGGANSAGTSGTANTGGGGGGSQDANNPPNNPGGNGGSGVVIISYPGSTQQMAGGTVTVAGGNVIHTFTSSGYLTPIVLVNNSLRFRSSASAYLNRTPSVASNRKTWTFSAWIKRGTLGSDVQILHCYDGSSSRRSSIQFNSDNTIGWDQGGSGTSGLIDTVAVYRDPSAWYHLVCVADYSNSTAANRALIYVNGVLQTVTTADDFDNADGLINSTNAHQIGSQGGSGNFFDGYMTDINFIDGQALTPNSFGTSNGLGVWQPIRYGGSYGTNGFYLPFNTNAANFAGVITAGSNQYLNVSNNAAFEFGTGDFTVEMYVYHTNSGSQATYWGDTPGNTTGIYFYRTGSNTLSVYDSSTVVISTVTVPSNQWVHVAAARSGTTLRIFINGNVVGTVTNSTNYTDQGCNIANDSGNSGQFVGYMSNVRVVKGTALYTTTFVPSTTNLTNVSGTSLLTLQNASIVDNSSNGFTVNNTGSVTTSDKLYPFSWGIFNDQSPQGNNWTANNISGAIGSTMDYMTDVPTLTSATAANYCVLNPLKSNSSTSTYQNGNLQVTFPNAGAGGIATGTMAVSSGKFYWEVIVGGTDGSTQPKLGIISPTVQTETSSSIDVGDLGYAYVRNGNKSILGSVSSYGASFTTNDVIGFALDMDAGTLVCYKNNSSQGTLVSGLSGLFTVGLTAYNGYSETINFGQRPFAYTPPTGFVALNTFNLPTPAIGATASTLASQNFNAVLYSGNNSTQTITVGFQPDFMWSKCTNFGRSHRLIDSVRGLSYQSFSDSVDGGNTYDATSYVSSITSTSSSGFAITNGGTDQYNTSGENYVSWAWKANGSGSTNTAGSIISTVSSNTTAGFSIVTYTGNATSGATVGHGCQVGGIATAPSMVILKGRSLSTNWYVYHPGLTSASYQIYLNLTSQQDNSVTTAFNSVAPGATTFTLPGTGFGSNNSGERYVAYCFAAVPGYSAFGTYTGNSSATGDGPFVYTGFRPRFVLWKNRTTGSQWILLDTARNTYNVSNAYLEPNTPDTENTANTVFDMLSNGFKIRNTGGTDYNASGEVYIYVAFAENPFKYANAR